MWSRIIYKEENQFVQDLPDLTDQDPETFIHQIAEGLYSSFLLQNKQSKASDSLPAAFQPSLTQLRNHSGMIMLPLFLKNSSS